jgi:hypothetical protein
MILLSPMTLAVHGKLLPKFESDFATRPGFDIDFKIIASGDVPLPEYTPYGSVDDN